MIERELGHGTSATVYLAHDRKHDRQVALKVLAPELALAVRTERFLREIQIAAKLTHPHILPLHDSGVAAGFLFYVMPYIAGESLRERLDRDGALPLEEALGITRDVASALSYAHEQGVVHRDIKPANILLSGGEAVVSDFGIARALNVAETQAITETWISLGTPAYMSPEQAGGSAELDGRSDIYSLGCVLYEMLIGVPPFSGLNVQSVLAKQITDPAPSVKDTLPESPDHGVRLVGSALAKDRDERFQTAAEFAQVIPRAGLTPITLPDHPRESRGPPHAGRPRRWQRRRVLATAASVVAAAVTGIAVAENFGDRKSAVDAQLLAVFPFRLVGDSSVLYLREGMVDLLAAKLTGESGPRAVDPRSAIAAWARAGKGQWDVSKDGALHLARGLGAGRLLLGEVVGTPRRVLIRATLYSVPGGGTLAQGVVEGSPDSVLYLVDGLAGRLLAEQAGEPGRRLQALTSTSLTAVKAYLEGRGAYRRGQLSVAVEHFTRALELDSTFALAALGIAASGHWTWTSESRALQRGLSTGYALRSKLGVRDQVHFEAYVGPVYPELHSAERELTAWMRAAEVAPESPEAWYELGDRLLHIGPLLGLEGARWRAHFAFTRALDLDSTLAPALAHLVELAALAGDQREATRLLTLYMSRASAADAADYVRWHVARAFDDRQEIEGLRARLARVGRTALNRIIGYGQVNAIGLDDVELAAHELGRWRETEMIQPHPMAPEPRIWAEMTLHALALNRGQPRAALRAITRLKALEPIPAGFSTAFSRADQLLVLDALYWDGDRGAAERAVRAIEQRALAPLSRVAATRARQYTDLCAGALWRAERREFAAARPMILRLSAGTPTDSAAFYGGSPVACHALLEAILAAQDPHADAASALSRLDSMLAVGPYVFSADFGPLVLARLLVERGSHEIALAWMRRRPYDWDSGTQYLSTYLLEEGRLATLTGDTAGAIRAYRHYLALRSDPEPSLQPEVERVRADVARLQGDAAPRPHPSP